MYICNIIMYRDVIVYAYIHVCPYPVLLLSENVVGAVLEQVLYGNNSSSDNSSGKYDVYLDIK